MNRRDFTKVVGASTLLAACKSGASLPSLSEEQRKPNIVFVFGDQWRAQATGYAGDPNVKTPHIDRLAGQSINMENAVSGCPVCSPYRGSLLTGMYPLHNGVFLNDARLNPEFNSIGKSLKGGGYQTAYIGKWHVDGHGRKNPIPKERRHGFDFWRTLECNHNYEESPYYTEEDDEMRWWPEPYDAFGQTDCAVDYIQKQTNQTEPFALFLSWGPPHDSYKLVPQKYKDLYPQETIQYHDNVPPAFQTGEDGPWGTPVKEHLQGYYAHCTALDECVGKIDAALESAGLSEDTIFIFTSDHGDMLGSHGMNLKQKPYEESTRVPFLIRYPRRFGSEGKRLSAHIDAPDLMPTLLSMAGIEIPESVQGVDYSRYMDGRAPDPKDGHCLLGNVIPFGSWNRDVGGREYRGVRTDRYTYVRDIEGPWLLFDNQEDPYQLNNRIRNPDMAAVRRDLEDRLRHQLEKLSDPFERGEEVAAKWGYKLRKRNKIQDHGSLYMTSPYL